MNLKKWKLILVLNNMELEMEQKLPDRQTQLLNLIERHKCLKNKIHDIKQEINNIGRDLLEELRKIDGWENMIEHCKEHYLECPDVFFGWCEVKHTTDSIYFEKGYSNDDDEYKVLEINLVKPLEIQVQESIQNNQKLKQKEEDSIREKELAELKRLKEKYDV